MGNIFIKPFLVVSQLMRSCSLGSGFGQGTPPPTQPVTLGRGGVQAAWGLSPRCKKKLHKVQQKPTPNPHLKCPEAVHLTWDWYRVAICSHTLGKLLPPGWALNKGCGTGLC